MTNDPKGRHVLAAPVRASAQAVVTFNKRHFPPAATGPWKIEAVGPSAFLEALYADGAEAGEAPDFFFPSMLAGGYFHGVRREGALVAAAGLEPATSGL